MRKYTTLAVATTLLAGGIAFSTPVQASTPDTTAAPADTKVTATTDEVTLAVTGVRPRAKLGGDWPTTN